MSDIFSKLYRKYDREIKNKIPEFPGSTKLSFLLYYLAERQIKQISREPRDLFERNWEHLIIIDACRNDLFKQVCAENSGTEISVGSSTLEYISKTFSKGGFEDIVYVSGNPHFHSSQFENLTGRDLETVFHTVFHTYESKWDRDYNTVMPESVITDAKTAVKLFPDKRKVIHFMQPHYPFVDSELSKEGINSRLDNEGDSVWRRAERGEYTQEEVWEAYKSNLEFVLPKAISLAEDLEGKTLVTSDHGNLVGENSLYGHPSEGRAEALRKVPSLVVQ